MLLMFVEVRSVLATTHAEAILRVMLVAGTSTLLAVTAFQASRSSPDNILRRMELLMVHQTVEGRN